MKNKVRRTQFIQIRLTPEMKRLLAERAKAENQTLTCYVLSACMARIENLKPK